VRSILKGLLKYCHRAFYTLFLAALICVYHWNNYREGKFFEPKYFWEEGRITLSKKTESLLDFPIIRVKDKHGIFTQIDPLPRFRTLDGSVAHIAGVGYYMRYLFHQTQPRIFMGPSTPIQRFFFLNQVAWQYPSISARVQSRFPLIRSVIRYASNHGVTPVIVVPPTALSFLRHLAPKKLPTFSPFQINERPMDEDSYFNYQTLVNEFPTEIPDLYQAYQKHLIKKPGSDVFGYMESHWSSLGIALAAKASIENLRRRGFNLLRPQLSYDGESTPDLDDYDFIQYLHLPLGLIRRQAKFQWREKFFRLNETVEDNRSNEGRVIVAGTSHAARFIGTPYSLGNIIADSLKRDLIDFSSRGEGLTGSFIRIKLAKFKWKKGDILIWEFPIHINGRVHDDLPFEIEKPAS